MIPRRALAGLVALLATGPVRAQAGDPARELAGLFMQGCLPFAGEPASLRRWATDNRLAIVPEPARGSFLMGAPGLVFDASNATGKYVVVSADDGLCSVIAAVAPGKSVAAALEAALKEAGATVRLAVERDDRAMPELHFREYLVTRQGRTWRVLAATVRGAEGRAMLTAGPG